MLYCYLLKIASYVTASTVNMHHAPCSCAGALFSKTYQNKHLNFSTYPEVVCKLPAKPEHEKDLEYT